MKDRIEEILSAAPEDKRWLVIDASAMSQVDSTAAEMFQTLRDELRNLGIRLVFAEAQ